jgi:hypothetical protein
LEILFFSLLIFPSYERKKKKKMDTRRDYHLAWLGLDCIGWDRIGQDGIEVFRMRGGRKKGKRKEGGVRNPVSISSSRVRSSSSSNHQTYSFFHKTHVFFFSA